MAKTDLPIKVKELLKKHDMLVESNFWLHAQSGKHILSHKACEQLAQLEKITFDMPVMIETDTNKKVGTSSKTRSVLFILFPTSSKQAAFKS